MIRFPKWFPFIHSPEARERKVYFGVLIVLLGATCFSYFPKTGRTQFMRPKSRKIAENRSEISRARG